MSIKCSLEQAGYRDGGNNLYLSGQTIFSMINNKNVHITSSILEANACTGCIKVNWSKLNDSEGQKNKYLFDFWCLVASGGLDICVSLTSFQKIDIGWPQQPPTERVSDISEKLDF